MKKIEWISDLQQSPTMPTPNHELPDEPSEMTNLIDSALDALLKIGEAFSESELAQVGENGSFPV
ncbi:hypothetical protein [Ruegeria sp. 6PALISEP08]|uniref:hypothetical protein n=1 Tax=Ruegeria sp. 6PALISEP08 TaxID=1225660 RepID=UPI00067F4F60|nr:hypothetical protein [Ruegeria sp. 6PALISEP08]